MAREAFCSRMASPAKFSMLKPATVNSSAAGMGTGTPLMFAPTMGVVSGRIL